MNDAYFGERRRVLEESFFARENKALLDNFRKQMDARQLAQECGLADEALARHLVDLGIGRETICALVLVPLIQIAWSDRKLDQGEKDAIMAAVKERGFPPESPVLQLIQNWLDETPDETLFESWQQYIRLLLERMGEEERKRFKGHLYRQAEEVAKSAGGVLGYGRISPGEQRVLDSLASL